MTILRNIELPAVLQSEDLWNIVRVFLWATLGFITLRIAVAVTRRVLRRRTSPQVVMLVSKGISYTGIGVIVTLALVALGVNLAPILGAAGIVGLAIGIASQASLSNIISGLFLVSEKPFEIGDVIRTGGTTGVVDSIDLLSVKIRTFDNLFVRVPNEKLAADELVNITRFPIRRLDFEVTVTFSEDLQRVRQTLLNIADAEPLALNEPEPVAMFLEFTTVGPRVRLGVWFGKSDFVEVRNRVSTAILKQFGAEGIRIPAGYLSVHQDDGTAFAVEITDHRSATHG